MRRWNVRKIASLAVAVAVCLSPCAWNQPAQAGGPLLVGGLAPATSGQPFTWDTATKIPYRTDGPTTSPPNALGTLSKQLADARVAAMFQVWEDVPTANIGFIRAATNSGNIKSVIGFSDADVNTVNEYNAVLGSCGDERVDPIKQSPIIYDLDGSLFTALGEPSAVIGFASPCDISVSGGLNRISGGFAALNGKWIDDNPAFKLTSQEFDQAFVHEFGHLAGLDHSQVNLDVLPDITGTCTDLDGFAGLPLMFPELRCQARVTEFPTEPLAPDDIAWISSLYPETVNDPPNKVPFGTKFGKISGKILFSDGVTQVQGANVIARQVDDPGTVGVNESRRNAVSVVSGYLFSGNPGQNVTGTNPGSQFGSHDATLIGFYEVPIEAPQAPDTIRYTVEVESIDPSFVAGSGVGPLGFDAGEQFPLPGPPEFWNVTETATDDPAASDPVAVTANAVVSNININITLNGTRDRFDVFESARSRLPEPSAAWLREERPLAFLVMG